MRKSVRRIYGKVRAAVLGIMLMSSLCATASGAWNAQWIAVPLEKTEPSIVITRALYGVSGKPEKQADVTAQIKQALAAGNFRIQANNDLAGGDPAYGVAKTLELEYRLDGVVLKKSVKENASLDLVTLEAKELEKDAPPRGANQWSSFRKEMHLKKVPAQAVARIAADSKYWLWVNGELVVYEGQLKRGPTPEDSYFDRVDLSPYLRKGDNTIAVLLWYFGKQGFSHNSSGKAGLLFDAQLDGKPLLSDNTWKASLHPAYGNTGAPHPNFRLPESNIHFDAGKDMQGWQNPGFNDSAWQAAAELGSPPCAPWNQLVERPIPLWKDFGLKDYVNADSLPKVSDGSTIKAKLPYNAHVSPYLKIKGPAGALIDIRMDNYKGGGPENVRAEYVTRTGVQAYENLGWMSGHEVHYSIPPGFEILELKYRETGYDTEFAGTFECDDHFFNRHREKALRTLYINMRDTYMDCPDRERAQWWGDVVNQLGEAFYALDTRSHALAKKGILELANWQRANDTIYSPVPDGNWNRELPMQMLNSVGYYGFWTYYLNTGDLETIRTVYPAVKRYLSVWKLGEDGLVISRKGEWTWGDWGDNKDMTILFNGWYYLALKGQKRMAEALGETGDIPAIEARMKSIEANFNKTFWDGREYRSPGYKGLTDDRAHALAVLAGLAKPNQYEAIREVLRTQQHSSPYMEKYVGEALYQMRFAEDALARTKERFREMTEHHFSTLWEIWNRGTINHAWSGGALTLLSQYGAGVAPIEPGYDRFHVLPQMGHLKYIKTTVPTVKGDIHLELRNEPGAFKVELTSPEDTVAVVGIPKRVDSSIDQIQINGAIVWQDGNQRGVSNGLRFIEENEHYLTFSVPPGNWSFVATFKLNWREVMVVAPRKRDGQGGLLPLQSYDETIRRGMSFILDDHLSWFKATETLLDEDGNTQMPWVYYSNVQHNGVPFPRAIDRFTAYPAFHHALMVRTLLGYYKYADDPRALKEAVKLADWEIAHSTPAEWAYGNMPYSTFEHKKPGGFRDGSGLMPDKAAIMALAYLDLYDASGAVRFLDAAEAIANTLSQRQRPDGTWPFRVDPKTERVVEEYTSSVIYAVMLFEKLDKKNANSRYRPYRDKTWNWLVNGPIKTKEFRGFYEDISPSPDGRTNYDCLDTIRYLLANRTDDNGYLEMAKELNLWIEATFMDKIKGFEPAEGIREQLQCNVVMGIHSLNWASMLHELAEASGDENMKQRAMQTANYTTYYLQPDNRIVVGFDYSQWWYSCHVGVVLYLFDFL